MVDTAMSMLVHGLLNRPGLDVWLSQEPHRVHQWSRKGFLEGNGRGYYWSNIPRLSR